MKRYSLALAFFIASSISGLAQDSQGKPADKNAASASSERAQVDAALNAYIDAFYTGDSTKIDQYFSTAIVKYGYSRPKDSTTYTGMEMTRPQMYEFVARVKQRARKLPDNVIRKVEVLDVLDQTAAGKVYAWWGTDYILLAKEYGKWMVRMVLWQSPERKN